MLNDYYPQVVGQIREMTEICAAEQPEFDNANKELERLLANRFVSKADEHGIERFERELGITPDRYDTLEMRKLRIRLYMNNKKNYSYQDLLNSLDVYCGVGNYDIEVDFHNDYININLYNNTEDLTMLELFLDKTLPMNIAFDIHVATRNETSSKIGIVWQADEVFNLKEAL